MPVLSGPARNGDRDNVVDWTQILTALRCYCQSIDEAHALVRLHERDAAGLLAVSDRLLSLESFLIHFNTLSRCQELLTHAKIDAETPHGDLAREMHLLSEITRLVEGQPAMRAYVRSITCALRSDGVGV